MGMCYKMKIMIGWRNVWSMKWPVPGQEVDQRKLGEKLWKKTVEHVDWIQRMPWIVVDGESRQGWLMTTMSESGWMFLLVQALPGCPRQNSQSRKTVMCVCALNFVVLVNLGLGGPVTSCGAWKWCRIICQWSLQKDFQIYLHACFLIQLLCRISGKVREKLEILSVW